MLGSVRRVVMRALTYDVKVPEKAHYLRWHLEHACICSCPVWVTWCHGWDSGDLFGTDNLFWHRYSVG